MLSELNPLSCNLSAKNIRAAIFPGCNLNCEYCDGSKARTVDHPGAMEDFRRTVLSEGRIDLLTYLNILYAFYEVGCLTGGEPMLNPDWDSLIREAKNMGYERVEMTTNGTRILEYLYNHSSFPTELTLLKVSLDTHDPNRYRSLTGGGELLEITRGISAIRETNPGLKLRANKVVLKRDLPDLPRYINFIESLNIEEINFLDLILTEPSNPDQKDHFEQEYVFIQEVIELLKRIYADSLCFTDHRYGYLATLPSGLSVVLKDSNGLTLRDAECKNCQQFCQEGLFTVRIATDGTASPCFDLFNKTSYIDCVDAIKTGKLIDGAQELMTRLINAEPVLSFKDFLKNSGVVGWRQ